MSLIPPEEQDSTSDVIEVPNNHICGETFSSHQAWILGGLSSAERLLQEQLGAPSPARLRADADLGP